MLNNPVLNPLLNIGRRMRSKLTATYRRFSLKDTRYPAAVWIENTNHCNASCVMCPREKQTRPMGMMPMELFERMAKEISQFKMDGPRRIHLHNYGEPLLDKKLVDRIRIAKELGIEETYFVTNASLLTPQLSEQIIDAGLDEFKISFYGTDKKNYNAIMARLDFDKTLDNLRRFFEIRKKRKAKNPTVIIQYMPVDGYETSVEEFKNIFEPMVDLELGDSFYYSSLHNYGGGRDYNSVTDNSPVTVCTYPWRVMVVLQDGQVAPCCVDFNGTIDLGNVNNNSIEEIWNGPAYKKMRKNFLNLHYDDYPVCATCDIPRN